MSAKIRRKYEKMFGKESKVVARLVERDKKYALLKAGLDARINNDKAKVEELEALDDAISSGDVALVRKLIAEGVDVNGLIHQGSALWGCEDEEMASVLIAAGADVNHQLNDGVSVIQEAAFTGQLGIIIQLLRAGASVNSACPHGATPVMAAAEFGHTSTVLSLIGLGADLHAKDILGKNALMTAAEFAHVDTIKALLCAGADALAVDEDQKGVLGYLEDADHASADEITEITEAVMAQAAKQTKQALEAALPAAVRSIKTQQRSRL